MSNLYVYLFFLMFTLHNPAKKEQICTNKHIILHKVRYEDPAIRFALEGEVFDSFQYSSELASAFQNWYRLIENNPLNFKALDTGQFHLRLKRSGDEFVFDTILKGNTPVNRKIMGYLGRKFKSTGITDLETLVLKLYLRKSKRVSASVDTLDQLGGQNRFMLKTKDHMILSGHTLGNGFALLNYAMLYKPEGNEGIDHQGIKVYKPSRTEVRPYGGFDVFIAYIYENFYMPRESLDIWHEDPFDAKIRFFFRVNQSGKIDSIGFISFYPDFKSRNVFYNPVCQELKRILVHKYNWEPKRINGKPTYAYYATSMNIRFND